MDYLLKNTNNVDWITGILVGCIALAALTKILYPLRFQEFLRLPINNKYFFVFGKNDPIYHPFNVLLFVVQTILISLLILLIFNWQNPSVSSNKIFLFFQICLGVCIFIIAKIAIEKSIGYIFNISSIINRYLYQKLSYRNLLSVLFLLVITISVYVTPMSYKLFYTFIGITAILNGIALFSSYKEQRAIIFPQFFYFILYLCALEISPYIILYKVLL